MIPKQIPLRSESLFKLATTHSSATNEPIAESYERLEFFGDAVLGIIVAEYLYQHHPDWDQGNMSKARASIVQEITLSEAAKTLGLPQYMHLGASEESAGGRERPSVLCDVFEAVIGAIYIESGLEKARWFVLEQLHPYLMRVGQGDINPHDFKSKLQEITQALWRIAPTYRISREDGAAHDRRFVVQVLFDNEIMGEGAGRSKKEAEQSAAKDALEIIERAQIARKMTKQNHLDS